MRITHAIVLGLAFGISSAPADAGPQDAIDEAFGLQAGGSTLSEVRVALEPHGADDGVRFAMGFVDAMLAAEGVLQSAYRHGFLTTFASVAPMTGDQGRFIMWFANQNPEPTTLEDLDVTLTGALARLGTARETLTDIDEDFKCVIDVRAIRFDINGDGRTTGAEGLGAFFELMPPRWRFDPDTRRTIREPMVPETLVVAFDRGDASWLMGYCHLLAAAGQWALAHDWSDVFDHTGHVFFPKAQIKYDFLPNSTWTLEKLFGGMPTPTPFDVTDVLAFFGNMRLPIRDADRMASSLAHLRGCVAHGKEMWSHYDREEDNDREWIPNPKQTAVFNEVAVNAEEREAWLAFLDEADAILHGKKVLRFWRGDGSRGIDVPKVFEEPRAFDLLYWLQGSAAAPYLREGEFTTPGTWAQLQRVFERRVFRFSFWFN
ncbi:MAG: hypothetical protein RLN60_03720 [Phycisphaerales bacterium]